MAWTRLPGDGLLYPAPPNLSLAPGFSGLGLIDATGEKFAALGAVWTPNGGAKGVRTVGFPFGAVTKAGGSGLTVSLQDVSLTAGFPGQPDETQDQTYAVANGNANFATNAWLQTGNMSADRSVTHGDLLAVVVEYDGGGRLGADSVIVRALGVGVSLHWPNCVLKTGGTWASLGTLPGVILGFSDGTFGTLRGSFPCSALNTHAFNSGTAGADEHALAFKVKAPCKSDGGWLFFAPASNAADFDVVLYDGTASLASKGVDASTLRIAAGGRGDFGWSAGEVVLQPGRQYYLAVKPTQATANVTAYSYDVSAAGHLGGQDAGQDFNYSSRVDAGAWAAVTATRRLLAGVRISSVDNGVRGRSFFTSGRRVA
jgi:hypothetical protein